MSLTYSLVTPSDLIVKPSKQYEGTRKEIYSMTFQIYSTLIQITPIYNVLKFFDLP